MQQQQILSPAIAVLWRKRHKRAGNYLLRYAQEASWREDNRRVSNGEQYLMIASAALAHPVSRQWKGYWRRSIRV